jgi:pimeloyl-ACP methyl ester carboxylesterase
LFTDEDTLRPLAPGLVGVRLLPGVSHWTIEEAPELVHEELLKMFAAGAQSASAG